MTKLLDEAIKKARMLSAEQQDRAAEILLTIVAQGETDYPGLTESQIAEIRHRRDDPRFASDEEVVAVFRQLGI
ncbi:MAG: hypothetical protein O3A84_13410 [Proteobacteria bacterium]|nr:hypothetical protein [Pseudomonadota bacterium]